MTRLELEARIKNATKTSKQNLDESFIHDKIIKLMKDIWKKTGDPDVPKDEIAMAVAHLDVNVIRNFTKDNQIIDVWDRLSDNTKMTLAKAAFGMGGYQYV